MTLYFRNFEEEIHDDIFLLNPSSEEHKVAEHLGPEDTQTAEEEEVPSLPHHVQAHNHNIVEEDVSLHDAVCESVSLDKVSQPKIELKWKVQAGETGICNETFK